MYCNIIKVIYDKTTASIIHSGEKLKAFALRLLYLFNIVLEVLSHSN